MKMRLLNTPNGVPSVPRQLMLAAGFMAAAGTIVLSRDEASGAWLEVALRHTATSLTDAGLAFFAFLLVFLLCNGLIACVYQWCSGRDRGLVAVVCGFLVLLVALNSFPILVYVEQLKSRDASPFLIRVVALLTANGMLYFFFSGFLFDTWREAGKLYAISAPFKGASSLDYLRERAEWLVLSNLSPLFYYLFSFTLFTDMLLQGYRGDDRLGIVLLLFTLLTQDTSSEGIWRFAVYLLTMMALVLPVRYLLDCLLYRWERKRRMTHEVL